MMKTKGGIKVDQEKENVTSTPLARKGLKVLQQSATGKENLAGRKVAESKLMVSVDKPKSVEDKAVQAGNTQITAEDLMSEEASAEYWKRLAEAREGQLNDSFKENERLKDTIDALEEENKICKDMLNESRCLVEVLKEMIEEEDETEDHPEEQEDEL